jgi:hypothetical protein
LEELGIPLGSWKENEIKPLTGTLVSNWLHCDPDVYLILDSVLRVFTSVHLFAYETPGTLSLKSFT